MTVGETLTEARTQAGLSVDELSERTKIRETVIRSIERDDYDALGGDIYVRGYVRSIASAVGIDAQPLIREYDVTRAAASPNERANGSTGKHALGFPVAGSADSEPVSAETAEPSAGDSTRFDLPPVSEDPAVTRFDLPPVPADDAGEPGAAVPEVPAAVAAEPAAAPDSAPAPALGPEPDAELAPELPSPPGEAAPETAVFDALTAAPPPPVPSLPPAPLPAVVPPPDPLADTRNDLPPVTDDLMDAGYDLNPEPEPEPPVPGALPDASGSATAIIPAFGAVPDWSREPSGPRGPDGVAGPPETTGSGGRRSHRSLAVTGVVAIVLIAGAALGISLAAGGTSASTTAAPAVRPSAASGTAAKASADAQASAAASASASASASRASASASAQASKAPAKPAAVISLPLASARAYGPDGFSDGDNPGNAGYTIASHPSQGWATQWYVTASFGMLKHGTGLLIDLGHQSTVAGIRLGLSQFPGATVQIRVGNGTAPSDLRLATTAKNAAGVVRLALRHPPVGRYVLIWFTTLPPDGAGHYQESVSNIMISGYR